MSNKFLLIILLLFSTFSDSICQVTKFKCFIKSVCNNTATPINTYSLIAKDTVYHAHNGVCLVSKPGNYTFYSEDVITGIEPIVFRFSSLKGQVQHDTIQVPTLYPVLVVEYNKRSSLRTGDWVYCQAKADGYKIDYYLNGQKRVEGLFKKGKPIDKLIFYSNNGNPEYIEHYNRRGKKLIEH